MFCFRCQYDLRNLGQNACPECGRPFDPTDEKTCLTQPIAPLPLLGEKRTAQLGFFFAGHRMLGQLFMLAMQLGIRAWGAAFIAMMLLIVIVEGESSHKRVNWVNLAVAYVVILFGFYVTHTLIPLLRRVGICDVFKLWPYVAGVLIAVIIFFTPLRP